MTARAKSRTSRQGNDHDTVFDERYAGYIYTTRKNSMESLRCHRFYTGYDPVTLKKKQFSLSTSMAGDTSDIFNGKADNMALIYTNEVIVPVAEAAVAEGIFSTDYSTKDDDSILRYYTVIERAIDVRSGPGNSYSIIGKLTKNTKVSVLSFEGKWAIISFNNSYGYVLRASLK